MSQKETASELRRKLRNALRREQRTKRRVQALNKRIAQLETLAFIDELTLLLKRTPVIARLTSELGTCRSDSRAARKGTESITILALDLVGFKRVNDTQGHEVADQALLDAANAIRRAIRANDLAARWGGDEFRVVLWNVNAQTASIVIDRIQKEIRSIGHDMDVRIGGVIWERDSGLDVTAASLLRAADDNERWLKRRRMSGVRITQYEH